MNRVDENQNQNERKSLKTLTVDQVISIGRKKLTELVGLKPLAVVEVVPAEDAGWTLKIEFIEREGIPNTMDIIGLYEALLDRQGQLLSYSRKDIRKRGDNYNYSAS
jgi:hypothetical protein